MTSEYYWTITKDRTGDFHSSVGVHGPRGADITLRDNATRWSAYDADGECYYEGMIYGDFTGFEPLDDFCMPDSGCTDIKNDGEWLYSVSLEEITSATGPLGLKIERDKFFKANKTLAEYADEARAKGRIAD